VTVNSAHYVVMIRNFFTPKLRRCRLNQFRIWFQQDGTTAHTSREAMAELRRLFPGKLISHRGDVPWLPPALQTCHLENSFCGGTSKEKCMSTSHEIVLSCRMQLRGNCTPFLDECVSRWWPTSLGGWTSASKQGSSFKRYFSCLTIFFNTLPLGGSFN